MFIVTSFEVSSKTGERFVETFNTWNLENIPLLTFVDGAPFDGMLPSMSFRLENSAEFNLWRGRTKDKRARGFGCKVFALNLALDMMKDSDHDWMIWLDSDVEFVAPIRFPWLDGSKAFAYLGRPWFKWSECGFVAYNLKTDVARVVLREMKAAYLRGDKASLDWGHDSSVFDIAREKHSFVDEWQDLTGHLDPKTIEQNGLHVWPETELQEFSRHHKGPRRKQEAYR